MHKRSDDITLSNVGENMTQEGHFKPQIKANDSELGKHTAYDLSYNPKRLFPIPRLEKRIEIGVDPVQLPFFGYDGWNHYEVSWLNQKGKPLVAIAEIFYDCSSPFMIESKSLKLYFNSLNNSKFDTIHDVKKIIQQDLEKSIGSPVQVSLQFLKDSSLNIVHHHFEGECIDDIDVECTQYTVEPKYLMNEAEVVTETLYSDLLKSNCLVTNQPDWGSVKICYTGKKINREGLLKYLISFRNHNEFHEQCIERIFVDIMNYCQPEELTVYGRYTRRGGLDINPYRTSNKNNIPYHNERLIRQ